MLQPQNDTEEFEFYLKFAKPLVLSLTDTNERIKAASWIRKLRKEDADITLRSNYLKLLLFVLQRRKLIGPFAQIPDEDKPLPDFPPDSNLQDVAKNFVEVDKRILKETLKKGGYGEWPPYNTAHASDLTEYASSQAIPNFGTQVYFAVSKFPIHTWDNFNKCVVPENEKLEVKTQIGGDISPDITCFVPETRPETPGKAERVGDKSGDGDFGWLDSMKPPDVVIPKQESPERDEFDVSDRVPPTWGSNLITIQDSPTRDRSPRSQRIEDLSLPEEVEDESPETSRLETPSPSTPCVVCSESPSSPDFGGESFMSDDQKDLRWMDSMRPDAELPTDEQQDPNLWDSFDRWTEDPDQIFQQFPPSPKGPIELDVSNEPEQWDPALDTPPLFSRDPKIREGPGGQRIYAPQEFGMESFEEPIWKPGEEFFKRHPCQSPFFNERAQNRQTLDMSKYNAPVSPKMQKRFSDIQSGFDDAFIAEETAPDLHALSFGEDDTQAKTVAEAIIESSKIGPIDTWQPPREDLDFGDLDFLGEAPPKFIFEPLFFGTPPPYEPNPEINEEDLEESLSKLIEEDLALMNAGIPVTTPKRSPMPRRKPPLLSESPPPAPDTDLEDIQLAPSPELATPPKYTRQPARQLDFDINIGSPIKANIPPTPPPVDTDAQEKLEMDNKLANLNRRIEILEMIGNTVNLTPPRPPPTPPPMPHLMDAQIPGRRLPSPIRAPPAEWDWKTPTDLKKPSQKRRKLKTPTGIPSPKAEKEGFPADVGLYTESPPSAVLSPAMAIGPLLFSPEEDFMKDVCGIACPGSPVAGPSGQPMLSDWQLEQMNQITYEDEQFEDLDETPPDLYRSPDRPITPENIRKMRQPEQAEPVFSPRTLQKMEDDELELLEIDVFGPEIAKRPQRPFRQGISPPRPVPPPTTGESPIPAEYEMRAWQQELELRAPVQRYKTKPMSVRPKPGKSCRVVKGKTPTVSPIKDLEFETNELNLSRTPPRIPAIRDTRVPVITPTRRVPPVYSNAPPSPDAIIQNGFGLPSPLRYERVPHRISSINDPEQTCAGKRKKVKIKPKKIDFDQRTELTPPRVPSQTPAAPPSIAESPTRLPPTVAPANWDRSPLRPEVFYQKTKGQLTDICRIDIPCDADLDAEEFPDLDNPRPPRARPRQRFEGEIPLPVVSVSPLSPASPETPKAEREAWKKQIKEYEKLQKRRKKKVTKPPELGSVQEEKSPKKMKTPKKYSVPRPVTPPGPTVVSEARDVLSRIAMIREQLGLLENTLQQTPQRVEEVDAEEPAAEEPAAEEPAAEEPLAEEQATTKTPAAEEFISEDSIDIYVDVETDILDTETIPDFLDTSEADICPITCGPTSEDDIGPLLTEQESLTTTGHPLFHEPVPYVGPQRTVDMEVNIGSTAPKRRILYQAPDYRAKEGVNYEEEANAMERQMRHKENEQKLQERRTGKVLYKTADVTQGEVEREHQEMKDMERKVANIDRRLELLETIGQSINVLPPQTPPTPPPMPHIMDESVPGRRLPPPMTMPPYNWGWKSPPDLKKVPQKKKKLLSPTRLPYSSQQGTSSQIYEDGLFAESPPNEALMEPLMLSPDADFMAEVCDVECPSSPVTGPAGQPIIQNWELEQMNDIELEQEEFADLDETPPSLYHSPPQTVDDDMDLDQEELERLELEVFGAEPIQPRTPCQGISRPQPAPLTVPAPTAGHSPIPDKYEMRAWRQELELMPLPRTYRQTRVMSVRPKPGKSYKVMGAKPPAGSPIKDEFEPDDRYLAHTPPRIPPIRDFRVPLITPPRTAVQSPLSTPTTPPRTGPPPNWNWVSPPQQEMEYYTPEAAAGIEVESPPLDIKSPEDGRCFEVCAEDQEEEEEEYDDFAIQPPEMDVIDIAQVDSQMFDQICESPPALYTSPEQRASSASPQRVSPRRVSPPRVSPPRVSPPRVSPPRVSPPRVSPPRVSPPRVSPPGVATPRAPRTPPQRQYPQYDRQQFMDSSIYLPKVEVLNRMGVLSPETPEREREAFRTGLDQYQPVAYKKKTFSVRPKSKTVRLGAKKPSMSFVQELPYAELVTPPRRPRTQPSERTRAVPTRPTTAPCAVPYTRSPMVLSPSAPRQHPMFTDSTRNPLRQIPLDTDLDIGQIINVREPERVILGDSTDEVVQEQLQYADEFERKMLNAERKQKIMTQVQEQYTMSPEQPLSMQPEEQEIIPDEDEDEPQPSMPPRGWDWSSPPEYAQPPRAKRAMQPYQTPARRQEQKVDELFTESPPMIMYSPPTLQSPSGPCADVCPSRSPRTSPVRSPRTSPVRSPRTSPVRSPRTSPVRSPQTTPIRSPQQISLVRPQQASPVRTPRISPVRSPGGRPVLESWPVQPIPDEFDWAANQADYSILQNEFPPALEDQSPPELPDYLKKARQQEALLYGDTSPTIQQQVMPRSRSPRATSPRARSPCAQVPETRIARSPVNTAEIEDLEMEIFGQLSPEYAPPIPKPMDLARMPTIQPKGGKRPGRRVGRVSYDPVVVDADELKDFRQLSDQVNPSTSGITYRDVMDESVPELQLDYSEISMMGNIPDYEPEVFNMFTDESLIEMDIREPFEGQPDTIFDTSIIDTELRDEDRYFKWMKCNTHCPSKK